MHWFIDPIKNQYADFSGRTGRKAFWMFVLVSFLLQVAVGIVEGIIGIMFIGTLFSLAILVPSVAITARRLHDTNKSGWWQLVALIPVLGIIVLIVLCAMKSVDENNKYSNEATVSEDEETFAQAVDPTVEETETPTEENKQQGFGN